MPTKVSTDDLDPRNDNLPSFGEYQSLTWSETPGMGCLLSPGRVHSAYLDEAPGPGLGRITSRCDNLRNQKVLMSVAIHKLEQTETSPVKRPVGLRSTWRASFDSKLAITFNSRDGENVPL